MLMAAVIVAANPSAAQEGVGFDTVGFDFEPGNPVHWDKFPFAGGHGNYVRVASNPKHKNAPVVLLLPNRRSKADWQYDTRGLASYLVDKGFAVASIEPSWRSAYRPLKDRQELAQAVGEVARQAAKWGYDQRRMILIGAGISGRDAAVFGTDPQWFQQEGVEFASLRAVVILNGDQIDPNVPHEQDDPAFEQAIPRPNAPHFLLHSIKTDQGRRAQANKLSEALRAAGAVVEVRLVRKSMDKSEPSMIGGENNPENDQLLRFLKDATAQATR